MFRVAVHVNGAVTVTPLAHTPPQFNVISLPLPLPLPTAVRVLDAPIDIAVDDVNDNAPFVVDVIVTVSPTVTSPAVDVTLTSSPPWIVH